ncbi:hypothetical protein [Brachybacterium huguangmaarense]
MSTPGDGDWTARRGDVIRARQSALEAARRAEHERATGLIREAIAGYRAAGIDPIPLRARTDRGASVRTSLTGWYLKTDRTIAVDSEARYYVMRVPDGLRARLRGADPEPTDAPMVVGRGARDGETFDLPELLESRRTDPVRP